MNDYWCIPLKEDADFVACMEDILDAYELPHKPACPVVRMDEKPYQLSGDVGEPLPMRPGDDRKTDSEYKRNGTCSIFAFVEPIGGKNHVSIHEHRTAIDWAQEIQYSSDVIFSDAEKIILVMDIHYLPKHGSQLDMADIELNVMTRQCLSRHDAITKQKSELSA